MVTQKWFFMRQGMEFGPVSSQQLKQFAASGKLCSTDTVCKEGTDKWVLASRVRGLSFSAKQSSRRPSGIKSPAGYKTPTVSHHIENLGAAPDAPLSPGPLEPSLNRSRITQWVVGAVSVFALVAVILVTILVSLEKFEQAKRQETQRADAKRLAQAERTAKEQEEARLLEVKRRDQDALQCRLARSETANKRLSERLGTKKDKDGNVIKRDGNESNEEKKSFMAFIFVMAIHILHVTRRTY